MNAENITESAEFRLRIRDLLYDYAITHLTTNYLTYTEDFVSEVRKFEPTAVDILLNLFRQVCGISAASSAPRSILARSFSRTISNPL